MNKFIQLLLTVVVIYAGFLLLLYIFQNSFIFFPSQAVDVTPGHYSFQYEDHFFQAEDGVNLHGWWIPHPEASATVILSHGNAGNISHRISLIQMMYGLKVNFFIYDYRGYGKSEGRPDEAGLYMDGMAAYYLVRDVKGINPGEIILFGRSIGGAVAAQNAVNAEIGGLVIESAFSDVRSLMRELFPIVPTFLAKYDFPVSEYLKQVSVPVMVMHSHQDDIIPYRHGVRNYEAANSPKWFIELQGGHNDNFMVSETIYLAAWHQFLLALKEDGEE
jgi:fermentation-respiration switch protein FrsA (DUF1100 family)